MPEPAPMAARPRPIAPSGQVHQTESIIADRRRTSPDIRGTLASGGGSNSTRRAALSASPAAPSISSPAHADYLFEEYSESRLPDNPEACSSGKCGLSSPAMSGRGQPLTREAQSGPGLPCPTAMDSRSNHVVITCPRDAERIDHTTGPNPSSDSAAGGTSGHGRDCSGSES